MNATKIVERNVEYSCGCKISSFVDQNEWEEAATKGLVRIDVKRNKLGEYVDMILFDYSRCNKCKKNKNG